MMQFKSAIVVFLLWALFCCSSQAAPAKPNVLLIMTDDQGWGDVACHGAEHLRTPVLDNLAKSGARFERFFVSPVCAPTRASLLTGRYSLRTGVRGVTRGRENMRTEELTIAESFRAAGYTTGCFGKWHNGRHLPLHPNGQGFDEFVGFCGGHWNSYFDAPLERNGQPFQSQGYITDVLTDEAISFIDRQGDNPWFCYVPYNAPHSPWLVPDRFFDRYKKSGLDDKTACAYAMVESLDENIGRILGALERSGKSSKTIVVFLTDNGPNSDRFNGDMRGRKGSVHEGGVRVPLFIRWPGNIAPGKTVEPICAHIDLLPTLLDMCGVDRTAGPPLDGASVWPLIQATVNKADWPDRTLFTSRTSGYEKSLVGIKRAVRTQRWRATFENNRWSLFDMLSDPSQQLDVAGSNLEVIAELETESDNWLKEVHPLPPIDPVIPIPSQESLNDRSVELPAHEATLTSSSSRGIRYAGTAGYANSWITDWSDTEATVSWSIDATEAQQWKATLLIACKPQDAGCRFRILGGDSKREIVVAESHHPDFNQSRERVPPSPRYAVRIWREISIGTLSLSHGRQEIRIIGVKRPGKHFAEIKTLRLKPLKITAHR
jgi:arylsulfatase A